MARLLRASTLTVALAGAAVGAVVSSSISHPAGQTTGAARTWDGKPDFSGIWQALNEAHWDLERHAARPGAVTQPGVYP